MEKKNQPCGEKASKGNLTISLTRIHSNYYQSINKLIALCQLHTRYRAHRATNNTTIKYV